MRELTGHKVNPANDLLTVQVLDEPGSGGANHQYLIKIPEQEKVAADNYCVYFQNGPIGEVGVNGITHEALLAILVDRLECFQAGPFANKYNGVALDYLRGAQDILQQRTKERMNRGVEGTHTV